jgi:flagellar protein FliO/FliZ
MTPEFSIVKPILSLFVVIGLIIGVLWFFKKIQNKPNIFGQKSLNIVEAISVGTREKVVLLDAGKKRILLGVTAHTITHLADIDQDGSIEQLNSSSKSNPNAFRLDIAQQNVQSS